MRAIAPVELMEFYIEALQQCGMYLLDMSDDDIEYYIFEEFDIGVGSFLHENSLNRLKDANLISEQVFQNSVKLRSSTMALRNTAQWNIESVRRDDKWRDILMLSDEIKSLLNVAKEARAMPQPIKAAQ